MRAVLLLRGINLGPVNRLPMAELRAALSERGVENVRTLLQSGNVVADWEEPVAALTELTSTTISERFGLEIPVIGRTATELAEVVERNPFPAQALAEPKRLQVTFLDGQPDPAGLVRAEAAIRPGEKLQSAERELYAWHPNGIADSKLALALTAKALGVQASSRNWATVTKLLIMATDAG